MKRNKLNKIGGSGRKGCMYIKNWLKPKLHLVLTCPSYKQFAIPMVDLCVYAGIHTMRDCFGNKEVVAYSGLAYTAVVSGKQ